MNTISKICVFLVSIMLFPFLSSCDKNSIDEVIKEEEKSEPEILYVENASDSLDAIVCKEGYVTLFGNKEIEIIKDNPTEEKIVYTVKADLKNDVIDENDATLIIADSLNYPVRIESIYGSFSFDYKDNKTVDCYYKLTGENEWKEITGMQIPTPSTKAAITRSLSHAGADDFTMTDALMVLDLAMGLKSTLGAEGVKDITTNGLGVVGNTVYKNNTNTSFALGTLSAVLTKNILGGIVTFMSTISQEGRKDVEKFLGHMYISIDNVKVINHNSVKIDYTTTGFSKLGLLLADVKLFLYKDDVCQKTVYLPVEDGSSSKVFSDLKPGKYEVKLTAFSLGFMGYQTDRVEFTIIDLEVEDVKVESDYKYTSGQGVKYTVLVGITGDENQLENYSEFGFYISFANNIEYHKVPNISTIFSTTPATATLWLDPADFDEIDYSAFTAKATGYKIGAYVVDKDRNHITHFGEKDLEGLIYNEIPSITFTSASIGENRITSSDADFFISFETQTRMTYDVTGAFWMNGIQTLIAQSSWQNNSVVQEIGYDGMHEKEEIASGFKAKTNTTSLELQVYFAIYLKNGATIFSNNSVFYSGFPLSFATVLGSRSAVLTRSVIMPKESTGMLIYGGSN